MKKGYYFFRECNGFNKGLIILGLVSFFISVFFLIRGGYLSLVDDSYYFTIDNAWCLFFLLLSIILFIVDICVHKICRDIATLLKDIEDKK